MPTEDESAAAGSQKSLRILVADDHPLVREGVALSIGRVPGWEVCGMAADGREMIAQALELRPDVIVLDLHMPHFDGVSAVRAIKERLPDAELVIFSGARADAVVRELFDAGVKSFIGKADDSKLLITAIRSAAEHQPFFTPTVSELLFSRLMGEGHHVPPSGRQLTDREREVIRQIADGKSNREIGAALGISSRTAETHRAAIMRKLDASSTAEIVRYAIRNGIVDA